MRLHNSELSDDVEFGWRLSGTLKLLKVSEEPSHCADLNLMTQIRRRFSADLNVKLTELEAASRGGSVSYRL